MVFNWSILKMSLRLEPLPSLFLTLWWELFCQCYNEEVLVIFFSLIEQDLEFSYSLEPWLSGPLYPDLCLWSQFFVNNNIRHVLCLQQNFIATNCVMKVQCKLNSLHFKAQNLYACHEMHVSMHAHMHHTATIIVFAFHRDLIGSKIAPLNSVQTHTLL